MKKTICLLTALSIICGLTANEILASENETTLVCHFEEDENGEMIEVCEEIESYQFCTPECWDA